MLKKGTFYLSSAWGVQLLAGYGISIFLARHFGLEMYGIYGSVMSILVWIETGILSGFPTAVQKYVAEKKEDALSVLKSAVQLQFIFILILFSLSFIFSHRIAGFLNDDRLTFYIRIAIIDVWLYGYFFTVLHLQNGLHNFGKQALLLCIYGVSKLGFVYVLAMKMNTITGALIGNIAGSAIGLILGIVMAYSAHLPRPKLQFNYGTIMRFATPIILYSLAIHLILNVDFWLVKKLIKDVRLPGIYYAASQMARVPYYFFFGLSATALPVMSDVLANRDSETARQTIKAATRLLLLFMLPFAALATSYGKEIITLLFGDKFAEGGDAFRILFWGMCFLAFLFLLSTIITADNKPILSLGITLCTLGISIACNAKFIPEYGLKGAAYSTAFAVFSGFCMAGILIYKRFKTLVDLKSLMKIAAAAGLMYLVSLMIQIKGLLLIPVCCVLIMLYFGFLVMFREIDIKTIFKNLADLRG